MAGPHDKRKKKSPVTVSGPWVALPLEFLRSRAFAQLSLHASRMLFDLCAQFGPNARQNGDLSAAPAVMRPRGWTSRTSMSSALAELIDSGLVCITRKGDKRKCTLYAVTLWPMDCDFSKLDHGPGAYATRDWRNAIEGMPEQPTTEHPATWSKARKNKLSAPATGHGAPGKAPARDNRTQAGSSYCPATDLKGRFCLPDHAPPRDTYLDKPSTRATKEFIA